MSYHGARKVIPTCSVMGPVKASLESCCRYLAYELGGKGIRVHAISPGPLKTRAASGLKDFDLLLAEVAQRAPISELVDIMDVGFTCAYLATPYARRLSGETLYVDDGVNIMAVSAPPGQGKDPDRNLTRSIEGSTMKPRNPGSHFCSGSPSTRSNEHNGDDDGKEERRKEG